MTFVECEGTGLYAAPENEFLSDNYPFAQTSRAVKIEILAADEHVQPLIDIVRDAGRTGYRGDGMILVHRRRSV